MALGNDLSGERPRAGIGEHELNPLDGGVVPGLAEVDHCNDGNSEKGLDGESTSPDSQAGSLGGDR